MKKFIAFITCFVTLALTVCMVSADASHFADGHDKIPFEQFGITMELPSKWGYSALDDSTLAMYPEHDTDTIIILHFLEYGSDDLHNDLENTFLKTAVEKSLEGIMSKNQDGTAEMVELTDGTPAAVAMDYGIERMGLCLSIHEDDYIMVLSYTSPHDAFEDSYAEDMDSILASVEGIDNFDS